MLFMCSSVGQLLDLTLEIWYLLSTERSLVRICTAIPTFVHRLSFTYSLQSNQVQNNYLLSTLLIFLQ